MLHLFGLCDTSAAPTTIGVRLCKSGHMAFIEVLCHCHVAITGRPQVPAFQCDATAGSTDRLAPLYLKLPAAYQPNVTFGMVRAAGLSPPPI